MADVTQLEPKKGRGKSPPTHLTTGEREELEAIRADKHLYWPHADGLGRGSKPVTPDAEEKTRQNDAEERDAPRGENARENDAESVTQYELGYDEGFSAGYKECASHLFFSPY